MNGGNTSSSSESASQNRFFNAHLEASVLGTLISEAPLCAKYLPLLEAPDFLLPHHQKLMTCLVELSQRGEPITVHTVQSRYSLQFGPLDIQVLLHLIESALLPHEMEHAVETLKTLRAYRCIVEYGQALGQMASKQLGTWGRAELLQEARARLESLEKKLVEGESDTHTVQAALSGYLDELEQRLLAPGSLVGLPTPFASLNELTGGFQRGDVIVIAARPGMGKTSFALQLAAHFATKGGGNGVFVSLEMPERQLIARLVSCIGGLSLTRCRRGLLNDEEVLQIEQAVKSLRDASLTILTKDHCTPSDLEAACYEQKRRGSLDFLVVDYLQLLQSHIRAESRNMEITHIVGACKSLALSFEIPVIVLSQLSRDVEKRAEKRPQLSDLRDSGSIEQAADLVFFLYRAAYYEKERMYTNQAEETTELAERVEEVELLLRKHRNGELGTIRLGFIPSQTRFVELDCLHETPRPSSVKRSRREEVA